MRILFFFLILLASCEKYYVSVRNLPVNASYLASSHVKTPDPRQKNPPLGEKLIIDWSLPPELLSENPRIVLYLIFKTHQEKQLVYPITSRAGYEVYSLLGEEFKERKGLLTYRAEIVTDEGRVYREWTHQLWVNLINFEEMSSEPKADKSEEPSINKAEREELS